MEKNAQDWEDLGPRERKVLTVLSVAGTRAEISRRTGLPRSTIVYILNKLLKQKFVDIILEGKRQKYSLSLRKTKTNNKVHSPITTVGPITFYTGKDALETLWKEIVNHPKESRLIGIQPRRSFSEAIKRSSKEHVAKISQEITNKKFIIDAIVQEELPRSIFSQFKGGEAKKIAKAFMGRLEDMVKVEPNFLDEKSEMFIIGKYSFFIDWFKEEAVRIENQNINNMFKSLYRATKAYGKRHEQGKYIEELLKQMS